MLGREFLWFSLYPAAGGGQIDSARCRPILVPAATPGRTGARFALKAPVILVHNRTPSPYTRCVPFADSADGLVLLGDRRPTFADLDYHLTTLSPPVRPRQWLEIGTSTACRMPSGRPWCTRWSPCSTTRPPPTSRRRPSNRSATAWDNAAQVGLRDQRLYAAANRCVAVAAEKAPAELSDAVERLVRSVEQGVPRRRFFRPGDRPWHRGYGSRSWRKGGCDFHGKARRRSGAGADADVAAGRFRRCRTLSSVRPVDEPSGGDLAHIGQQETGCCEAVTESARDLPPAVEGLYDAFEHSRASRVELPLLSRSGRGRTTGRCDPRRWMPLMLSLTTDPTAPALTTPASCSAWWSATKTSTTKPCCRH